ncbi:MAG TPA: prolipoprotein diacylglyceryl transferase [Myxococcota bacterium]|nr:prolipoprotein diacylglyceryl transferase [Myxococcota bacterium]
MVPELFTIFGLSISPFGVTMALAFLVGSWITAVRMREEGLDPELATTLLVYVMLGGIAGSKLYYAIDTHLRTGAPFTSLLFARDGITWYGGLVMATLVGAIGCRIHGVSIRKVMDCTAVAGAVGQAIGRVGCFLVGDDYGRPTDLPWGVSFPKGAPPTDARVHPTQIYEILWLLPVAGLLWKRRHVSPFLFGEYLALNGLGRFFIETLRVNPKVVFGLTEPQIVGIALILGGVSSWLYFWRRDQRVALA